MSVPTLDGIPREIFLIILELLPDRRDVNRLCRTSKRIYEETVPHLYKSISLYASEPDLGDIDAYRFLAARQKGLLHYTQNIEVWSRFDFRISQRCMHMDEDVYDIDESELEEELAVQLRSLLQDCETGKIRSLEWAMGTCIPNSLLGPTGLLTLNQQNLESIRLVTDGRCSWNEERGHGLALGAFPHLKRLSWIGLSTQTDFDALDDMLDKTSHQLEELEIDLEYHQNYIYSEAWDFDSDDEGNRQDVASLLGLSTHNSRKFPSLKRLALTSFSFPKPREVAGKARLRRVCEALDLSSLQSLKLRDCEGWDHLIRHFTQRAEPLNLRSFELQQGSGDFVFELYEVLVDFLRKVQGLEELFLSTDFDSDTLEVWKALSHHHASIRRFVHHQHTADPGDGENFELVCDLPDLSFVDTKEAQIAADASLGGLNLTSLGLCCIPSFMRSFVCGFASKTCLQVLHMRQSGSDLEYNRSWAECSEQGDVVFDFAGMDVPDQMLPDLGSSFVNFAQWVFGPTGIRSLRLLAYGDFSNDGRFQDDALLLCRRDPPPEDRDMGSEESDRRIRFRVVREEDTELWELFESEKHVLEACPGVGLLM